MSEKALFGPAGNSASFTAEGYKHTYQQPAWLASRGLDAYEYSAGNGITGSIETFRKIGEEAKKYGIAMSLHTPYFISLSGIVEETRLKSINYIGQSLEAASALGADTIVIHTGSASKITREEAVALAKDTMYKVLDAFPDTKIRLGLETMGKVNQLGTLDEVIDICSIDPRLHPVVDFGHMNARANGLFRGEDDYKAVFEAISSRLGAEYAQNLHCHFSKIEYGPAGEKKHLTFEDTEYGPEFAPLAAVLVREGLTPRIICESAKTMAEDAAAMKNMYLSELNK